MFSNFVIFTEVVKLSPVIHYNLERLNFDLDIINLVFEKRDFVSATVTFKLIERENMNLLRKFVELTNLEDKIVTRNWIILIVKTLIPKGNYSRLRKILMYFDRGFDIFVAKKELIGEEGTELLTQKMHSILMKKIFE